MAKAGEKHRQANTQNLALSVGEKILALRKRYGLSQRELARRAEMTNSSLSTIEQGKASPSIASLEKILSAIPISLQAFFAEDLDITPPVQRAEEFLLIKKEGMENRVMSLGEGASQLAHQCYAPGAQIHSEWMVRQGFVGGLLIKGELHLKLEGTDYVLNEGDGFYFALNRSHAFHNESDKECIVVSISFTR